VKGKIKILRIFTRLSIGGPAIHTILLTAALNDLRFESTLVKGTEDPEEGNMVELSRAKGVEPVFIPEMGRAISLWYDFWALVKIVKLILDEEPDIVHTHTAKAGALGRTAAILVNFQNGVLRRFLGLFWCRYHARRFKKVLLVHTFHGHILKGYFGKLTTLFFISIERLLGLVTDRIITVSDLQQKEILDFGIGNPEKVIAVPLGLELDKFLDLRPFEGKLRSELGVGRSTLLIGIVARLVPIKNHRMFLEAVRIFFQHRPAAKVLFLVIGDGLSREIYEGIARKRGIQKRVRFLGFRMDLESIYADLDVHVLTSMNEGSPVAMIESMAAGKPVIATDVGGVRDLLTLYPSWKNEIPGLRFCREGILLKPGDVKSLVRAIERLVDDPSLRQAMGAAGRCKAYPKYNAPRLIGDMRKVYEELIEARRD